MTRPIILIPTRRKVPPFFTEPPGMRQFSWQYRNYADSVRRYGAVPIHCAVEPGEAELRQLYDLASGVLLCGGADVDSGLYGMEIATEEWHAKHVDRANDDTDIALVKWALEDDKPLFGVCRGAQIMAVANGGSLYQDIPTEIPGALTHFAAPPATTTEHDIAVRAGTGLAGLIGAGSHHVNSRHHQSILEPGEGFSVSASAQDGVVEAIESASRRFAFGVQWHPEELVEDDASKSLFAAFVDAAGEFAGVPLDQATAGR